MNGESILYPSGRYNPAGTTKAYYAYVEDILSFPTLADSETATTHESLVNYTAAIVMKQGKQFHEYYGTLEESELKGTLVGPRDGKGWENTFEISHPGNDAKAVGFHAASANRPIVWLVKEKNAKLRVLGSLEDPSYLDAGDYTSGKKIADSRRTITTYKASGATPPPIYTLPIAALLAPAV